MRPQVDTTLPTTVNLDHLRNNLKGEQLLEERYREIDRENRILLQKMSDAMKQQSHNTPRTKSGPPSLNRDARKTELMRITSDNFAILKRIQQAQPVYNHIAWEDSYKKSFGHLKNAAEFPVVLRRKVSFSGAAGLASIGQGGGDARQDAQPKHDSAGKLEAIKGSASDADELRYVLKEGRQFGGSYYLVEMATDGCSLAVSAFDNDAQKTLELVVNERNHRKLHRECRGDYGLIADRLAVEGGALFIDTGGKNDPVGSEAQAEGRQQEFGAEPALWTSKRSTANGSRPSSGTRRPSSGNKAAGLHVQDL